MALEGILIPLPQPKLFTGRSYVQLQGGITRYFLVCTMPGTLRQPLLPGRTLLQGITRMVRELTLLSKILEQGSKRQTTLYFIQTT